MWSELELTHMQRISRRVIAEQHLALTETFNSPWHFPDAKYQEDANADFIGEVFLRCNAREVIDSCWNRAIALAKEAYGPSCALPNIKLEGHLDATFPYILSHLQYVIGELLRNSIQAVVETRSHSAVAPPPIEVLVCEAPQHVTIRISDQGGGIPEEIMPGLWSFSKGARRQTHLRNLSQVPKMAATMQELEIPSIEAESTSSDAMTQERSRDGSLSSLTSRRPNLRLGIGLPMSRVYAELVVSHLDVLYSKLTRCRYWAGSLELHSLEGYGVDVFFQISKLGNKNEQLSTRASMDAV